MRLSKAGLGIVAAVVVAWIAVLALIIALRPTGTETRFEAAGALEQAVAGMDEDGLNVVGLSPGDIYGEEWIAAAVVCPFATEQGIAQTYEADASELNLGTEGVPEDTNYLLLRDSEGGQAFDRIDRSEIDLCTVPLQGYFDSRVMLPLGKTQEGGWALLG